MAEPRHSGSRYSPETRSKVLDLYQNEELSAAAISRLPDMPSEKTTRTILHDAGVKQLRGNAPHFDRAQILRDLRVMNPKAVAKKHNCSERHVFGIRKIASAPTAESESSC